MQNPYNYTYTVEQGYTFTTDYSIDYIAYFTDGSDYFSDFPEFKNNVVSFGFTPIKINGVKVKRMLDSRIQYTISSILNTYLADNPDTIVLFICDTRDNLHLARRRLFDKWYSSDKNREDYHKIDEDICADDDCLYCSVIFGKRNRNERLIQQGFYTIANQLRNK